MNIYLHSRNNFIYSYLELQIQMKMTNYNEQLINALANLEAIKNQLFDSVINLGMHGIHADINAIFEPGDSYMFELAHFDDSDDLNLQHLVNLIKQIDNTSQRLLMSNNMTIEEVDF